MTDPDLVARLERLDAMGRLPGEELEWLVAHGDLESYEAGAVVGAKDQRIHRLWIVLSGYLAVHVDRGAGPRRILEWRAGDVSGMLPYSRMAGSPGDNCAEEPTELLAIHEDHFPEMIHRCPQFTARTVHTMIDRARSFNTSDLHDEKMVSLGKLAAGLAHELNNPASATVRSAKMLVAGLDDAAAAARTLASSDASDALFELVDQASASGRRDGPRGALSPLELSDREDELVEWLARHECDPAHAAQLAAIGVTTQVLDTMAREASGDTLDAALRWVVACSLTGALAAEIGQAATRIHDLVTAVKKFTYMDNLAGPEVVDVEAGLRDTMAVLASKANAKGVSVTLTAEPNLPRLSAVGSELNQVWMSLIENALDAIEESGNVHISVGVRSEWMEVCVVDDGPGIAPEILPHIFDPFFTTKPPGQGAGLGLETARRLVRRHRGDISVESRPGRTEFRVSLTL
jgi:signal transduction histidine kinase